jgi:hypothetical protein
MTGLPRTAIILGFQEGLFVRDPLQINLDLTEHMLSIQ